MESVSCSNHVIRSNEYSLEVAQPACFSNYESSAAEMQAIDRTHRLGQHRLVRAVRFIAEGTVDERVLQLQEIKKKVFDGTVGR